MDEPTRSAWSRPELIVLVRSGPEEAIFSACKDGTHLGDPENTNIGCRKWVDGEHVCESMCSLVGVS